MALRAWKSEKSSKKSSVLNPIYSRVIHPILHPEASKSVMMFAVVMASTCSFVGVVGNLLTIGKVFINQEPRPPHYY